MRAIVGAKGKIGSRLLRSGDIAIETGDPLGFGGAETVIYAAIDWSAVGRPHMAAVLDALEAAAAQGVRRFIFCSSVWAAPEAYGLPVEKVNVEYRAAKLSCEEWLRSWCTQGRDGVALRIGAFHPDAPETDAPWRLTAAGLDWHVRRAEAVTGYHCWVAMGDGERQNGLRG